MTPASDIIARCGGFKSVADWLGLDRSAVQRWTYPAPKGTGEQVPLKHWVPLIDAAERAGVSIKLHELLPFDVAQAARKEALVSQ